jgi:hypothetical protein
MSDLEKITIVNLSEEYLKAIRDLEKKIGDDVCLVAIHKRDVLYVIEAKLSPNVWNRVDIVYPEIKNLKSYYNDYNNAKLSKSSLKTFLINNKVKLNLIKRPIRIRQIINTKD